VVDGRYEKLKGRRKRRSSTTQIQKELNDIKNVVARAVDTTSSEATRLKS